MRTEFPVKDDDIRALKIKVLRDLAAAQYPREALGNIAMKHGITVDDARALVLAHGWPEARSMSKAADALEGNASAPVAPVPNRPPAAGGVSTAPVPKPPTAAGTVTVRPTLSSTPAANSTEQMIASGEKSPKARTRRLATKIRKDLAELRGLVIAERKEAEAAQVKAEETARLKGEVAELERMLAAKKAALRPVASKPKSSEPKAAGQQDSKAIRAWAAEHGIDCSGFGRVPAEVVEAYEAAHSSEGDE